MGVPQVSQSYSMDVKVYRTPVVQSENEHILPLKSSLPASDRCPGMYSPRAGTTRLAVCISG